MTKEPQISFNISEEKMQNKNYNLSVLALASLDSEWLSEDKSRRIAKVEFKARLKELLGMTLHKTKVVIDTFIDLGIMKEENDYYILNPVETPFVRLYIPTVRFCLDVLDPITFKVYCYLVNIYNMHEQYHKFGENYFFSESELIKICGYSRTQKTQLKIKQVLAVLEDLGLIEYNSESVGRPGKHGTYHELYYVSNVAKSQIKAAQRMVDDSFSLGADILEDVALPGVDIPSNKLTSGIPKCFDGVNWYENQKYKESMLVNLLKYPEENHDYLEYYDLMDSSLFSN